ncbi:MAG: hypothetical protein WCG45_00455 [bacterium]
MSNLALEEWLNEDEMGMQMPGAEVPAPSMPQQGFDPNAQAEADPSAMQQPQQEPQQEIQPDQNMDVSNDPPAPDMPEDNEEQDFEQWKDSFFKEATRNDVLKLIDMINQVRDLELDSYPRKFVEDNLQVCFLRQNSNIDKMCKEVRRLTKESLDQNNPTVSLVNHIFNTMRTMPELNNIFIKLKGLLGMKGDLHRKFVASLTGSVQVGTGGNNEDLIFNDRDYSIKLSTRYNDKWGKVDLGRWSLKEDDANRYLTEPEQKRLEDGSPEEKEVLRKRIIIESLAETFKKRGFIINVVGEDGTVYTLGWDLSGSIKGAYGDGKLVVKTIQSENSEAMIDDKGTIVPYVDVKIKYVKETGGLDAEGKPEKEEIDFIEKIDGMLFLTAQFLTVKEASTAFPGIVLKETPYNGNPSDLKVIMRCVPNANELLLRVC